MHASICGDCSEGFDGVRVEQNLRMGSNRDPRQRHQY